MDTKMKYIPVAISMLESDKALLIEWANMYAEGNISYLIRRVFKHPDFPQIMSLLLAPNRVDAEEVVNGSTT